MRRGGAGAINRAGILATSMLVALVALIAACGGSATTQQTRHAAIAIPTLTASDTATPTAITTATATRVPPTATPYSRSPTPTPPRLSVVTVDIVGTSTNEFSFSPQNVTIKVGTTVKWVNNTSVIHTSTRKSGPASWDSGTINLGASFSFTFTVPGTFTYECSYHPQMSGMHGTIVVTS
jgi:plastocyanin